MSGQAHLWAIGYDGIERAEQVRSEIARLVASHCLELLDSAVAVRYSDGSFTLDGEPYIEMASSRGGLAAFFLSLTMGAPPLSTAAVGAIEERLQSTSSDIGIDCAFIAEVRKGMKPNTSALFVLDREGNMTAILDGIRGLGGTVLKTNVDIPRAKLVQATLAAAAGQGEDKR